ncbi:GDSL-type esterase/lipase family protein [Glutamicibacter sp. JL.03c]|uniref:GDSL-type esterase/lipase family protein n=1 Tax=Glutamicibacter sp. JL.03c TaxID=2984842 RepID=UPI0021F74920|nr:GDSL-type esterase/lipase family protein [Glutamicibacter sp. JL.03c]UYQ78608.1 GDSL-type esterase/lipase family protein [Glutamicibacter sp. JL.03c]
MVTGVGDETHRGWAGRLIARGIKRGYELTGYNLGVRGDTSSMIRQRFEAECAARLPPGGHAVGVVFSFGVNDVIRWGAKPRLAAEDRIPSLAAILDAAGERSLPALMIGPPALADDALNAELLELDAQMRAICRPKTVPYLGVHEDLAGNELWRREVAADDGAHPRAAGYDLLAGLASGAWDAWLQDAAARLEP